MKNKKTPTQTKKAPTQLQVVRALKLHTKRAEQARKLAEALAATARQHDEADAAWAAEKAAKAHAEAQVVVKKQTWWQKFWG